LREAERLRRFPAEVEQVVRNVREHDMPRAAAERAESDHPLAAADVEQRVALSEAGPVEHLVAHRHELVAHPPPHLRIAAVAALREPLGSDVALLRRRALALRALR